MLYFQSEKKCIINIALLKFSVVIGSNRTDLSIQKDNYIFDGQLHIRKKRKNGRKTLLSSVLERKKCRDDALCDHLYALFTNSEIQWNM